MTFPFLRGSFLNLLFHVQMGGIDESAIDKLSSVCEFAKLIQSKSGEETMGEVTAALMITNTSRGSDVRACLCPLTGSAGQPSAPTSASELSPSFLWLLRDFQFQLNEDGKQVRGHAQTMHSSLNSSANK